MRHDPNKKNFSKYLEEYVKPQLRELLTGYGPVAVLWFDIMTPTPEQAKADALTAALDKAYELKGGAK